MGSPQVLRLVVTLRLFKRLSTIAFISKYKIDLQLQGINATVRDPNQDRGVNSTAINIRVITMNECFLTLRWSDRTLQVLMHSEDSEFLFACDTEDAPKQLG